MSFGAMLECHPISAKENLDCISLEEKSYTRGGIWKGYIMVADIEELEELDASELHARRHNAKEVLTPQRSGNIIFPPADGTVRIFEARRRTSTLTRDRSERGEEQEILQGKSDELHSPNPTSRRLNAG